MNCCVPRGLLPLRPENDASQDEISGESAQDTRVELWDVKVLDLLPEVQLRHGLTPAGSERRNPVHAGIRNEVRTDPAPVLVIPLPLLG